MEPRLQNWIYILVCKLSENHTTCLCLKQLFPSLLCKNWTTLCLQNTNAIFISLRSRVLELSIFVASPNNLINISKLVIQVPRNGFLGYWLISVTQCKRNRYDYERNAWIVHNRLNKKGYIIKEWQENIIFDFIYLFPCSYIYLRTIYRKIDDRYK